MCKHLKAKLCRHCCLTIMEFAQTPTLVLHSCDPDSAASRLKSAVSWCHRASAGIQTIMLGSPQVPDQQLAQALIPLLRAWASRIYPLRSPALQWVLEGQSRQRWLIVSSSLFRGHWELSDWQCLITWFSSLEAAGGTDAESDWCSIHLSMILKLKKKNHKLLLRLVIEGQASPWEWCEGLPLAEQCRGNQCAQGFACQDKKSTWTVIKFFLPMKSLISLYQQDENFLWAITSASDARSAHYRPL